MRRTVSSTTSCTKGLSLTVAVAMLLAQAASPVRASSSVGHNAEVESLEHESLQQLLKDGEYDTAIERLAREIEAQLEARDRHPEGFDADALEEAYLLLIQGYVLRSNECRSRGDMRMAARYIERAEEEARACLGIWELRHVEPVALAKYPPEMIELFRGVRSELFGAFRVIELIPPTATVTLSANSWTYTLDVAPGESLPSGVNIPVGTCRVDVAAEGYRTITDEITISPGATQERRYELRQPHGFLWYFWRVSAAAAAAGLVAWAAGGEDGAAPPALEPLPEPPDPPQEP